MEGQCFADVQACCVRFRLSAWMLGAFLSILHWVCIAVKDCHSTGDLMQMLMFVFGCENPIFECSFFAFDGVPPRH